jgi:hypothetical protein
VAEDPDVQHVGIGDQHPRQPLADRPALRRRRVAVVDLAPSPIVVEAGVRGQPPQLAALVLAERLEREQEQPPSRPSGHRLGQRRELEDQRLPRRGGSGDEHVPPLPHRREPLRLVAPQPLHAAARQRPRERRRQRRIELAEPLEVRRQERRMDDLGTEPRVLAKLLDEPAQRRGGSGVTAHSRHCSAVLARRPMVRSDLSGDAKSNFCISL